MNTLNQLLMDTIIIGKRADALREQKKLTIEKLAALANVNKNTVVRFLKGKTTRMETIYKICMVLGATPHELIAEGLQKDTEYRLQTKFEEESRWFSRKERRHYKNGDGLKASHLNYRLKGGSLNASVLEVGSSGSVHRHNGEEFLFCLTGKICAKVGAKEFHLEKGDALFFWGSEPHQYINGDKEKEANNENSVALSVWIDPESDIEKVIYGENFKRVEE